MNISRVSSETFLSYEMPILHEINVSPEEREWLLETFKNVSEQNNMIQLGLRLSNHIQKLNTFEPEKIINMVHTFDKTLAQYKGDRKLSHLLTKEAAKIFIDKSPDQICTITHNSWNVNPLLTLEIVIGLARRGNDPVELVKEYKIPYDATTYEGKYAFIAIAEAIYSQFKLLRFNPVELNNSGVYIDPKSTQILWGKIAKLAAQRSGSGVSFYINKYGIDKSTLEGQRILIEIAKLAAQQEGRGTSEFIQNYGIDKSTPEGQKALVEIAKIVAQQEGGGISEYIHDYGIDKSTPEGQKALVEIAMLSAQQNGGNTSCYIQNYGFDKTTPQGQKILIEIAELAAQKDGTTSNFISNYGIDKSTPQGQKILIEIAKLAARKNGWATSVHIQKYGIDKTTQDGQKALIEIAKLAAQQNGTRTSDYFENYGIDISTKEGKQGVIEIAKLAAQQNGWGTSKFIQNYGIDDSTSEGLRALIEIFKLALEQDSGYGVAECIQNYGIDPSTSQGQKTLGEIARLTAQKNGCGISKYIEKYLIDRSTHEGKKTLIEIAKMAAWQNGFGTSLYIQNYGIDKSIPEGQQALIEIAALAAKQNGEKTADYIQNYGIDAQSPPGKKVYAELSNLMFLSIVIQLESFSRFKIKEGLKFFVNPKFPADGQSTHSFTLGKPFFKLSRRVKTEDTFSIYNLCLELCNKKFNLSKEDLKWVEKNLNKKDEPFVQKRFLEWFLNVAAVCSMREDLGTLFKVHQNILKEISRLNPRLREALTKEFIYLCYDKNHEVWERLKQAADRKAHAELASLVFTRFPSEGEKVYIQAIKTLKTERIFRDGKHQKLLLETLLKINNSALESKTKYGLIDILFKMPLEKRLPSFRLICDLLAFKGEAYIREAYDLNSLQKGLEDLIQKHFHVKFDNFSQRYEKTIGTWRNKECLLTYAGKLNELPEDEKTKALQLFQELLKMIFDGSFQKARYAIEQNPHMDEISRNHPAIFEKWQLAERLVPSETECVSNAKEISREQTLVKTLKEALAQNHLGGNQQKELYPILSACIGKWDNLKEELANIEKMLIPVSSQRLMPEEIEERKRWRLQKGLLELISDPQGLEKKLTDLKSLLNKEMEFYHDIESSLKILQSSGKSTHQTYQVIDTDDPNHFLLMGTEVEHSCQRIDGDAKLNKCLLGYFLDGKHRLGLVCDSQGKIVARLLFRLLIDALGQPVLFQEKMYVADAAPEYAQLLRKLALKKAASLGIPLVISKSDVERESAAAPYPYILHAKQKPVPFEYVDALRSIQTGPYEINDAIQLI